MRTIFPQLFPDLFAQWCARDLLENQNVAELYEIYDDGERLKGDGKLEEAVAKFNEALAQEPNYALAHFALAVVHGKLNQHQQAVEHAEKAVQLEPREAFSYSALSVTYHRAFEATRDMRYVELAEQAKTRAHEMGGHTH